VASKHFSRRNFLKTGALGTLSGVMASAERIPAAAAEILGNRKLDDPFPCAVIGYGEWGREIAAAIADIEELKLAAICDNFPLMLRRAQREHPQAARIADYREVLDNPEIVAVFIATATHEHKDLVLDALQAGKHVYCEAPLAHTIEDARTIAKAGLAAKGQIFQAGMLYRTEPQYRSVFGFVRSGAIGRLAMSRSQWHSKQSWRRTSSDGARAEALNWRTNEALSLGLIGEIGVQQIDVTSWILGSRPKAVSGFGGIMYWNDGRTVKDTIQAIIEYPGGENLMFDATLVSGFDAAYDLLFGNDATIILRDEKAWMFKEVDAPMLGWEVYARKDRFYKETGIALLANATKLDALGQDPTADDPNAKPPIWHACKAFADNLIYGPFPPVADAQLGFECAVLAIKANEAVQNNTRVEIPDELYRL
jgi:predicted dehydrogenase